jgi:hypothetical protein
MKEVDSKAYLDAAVQRKIFPSVAIKLLFSGCLDCNPATVLTKLPQLSILFDLCMTNA